MMFGRAVPALVFGETELSVARHLMAEPSDIGDPLAGIDEQVERQSRLGAERVARLKLPRLSFGPSSMTLRIVAGEVSHCLRRIVRRQRVFGRCRPGEERAPSLDD